MCPSQQQSKASHHLQNRKTVDEDFSTATWVIEEALNKVLTHISVAKEIKVEFCKAYCEAHKSGNPRLEEKVAIELLASSGWEWHVFDKWYLFFSQKGVWPYMWHQNELTKKQVISNPTTIEEAVSFLNVKKMKKFLKQHDIKTKPAPKKRAEFEKTIIQNSSLDDVLSSIKSHLENQAKYAKQRFAESKCKILAHTLCMTAYSLRDHYKYNEGANLKLIAHDSGGTCKVEDSFVKKFNTDQLKALPPFFPGDRTSIMYTRKEMNICTKCHTPCPPDKTECPRCGVIFAKYKVAQRRKHEVPKLSVAPVKQAKQVKKEEKKGGILGCSVIVLFLSIPVLAIFGKTVALLFLGVTISMIILGATNGQNNLDQSLEKLSPEEQNKIGQFVKKTLTEEQYWEDEKRSNQEFFKIYPEWAGLIRLLQIIRDSINLAITSKKQDTAESRMELALCELEGIKNSYSHLASNETLSFILQTVIDAENQFRTSLYINTSKGHMEHAAKLKTIKGQHRHLQLAYDIVKDGLQDPASDKDTLHQREKEILALLQL